MQRSRNGNKVSASVKCWKIITQPPRSTNIPVLQIYGTFLKTRVLLYFEHKEVQKTVTKKTVRYVCTKISCKAKVPNLKSSTTQTQAVNKALGTKY
jgi:hypothetical protein